MSALADEIRPSTPDPLERVRRFAAEIIHREFESGGQNIRAEHEMLLYASTDNDLAAQVRDWNARWVGHIAGDLEAAGWSRPVETARTIINLIQGFEIERLINPQVDTEDFRRRLEALLVR
jgi:hypothetical protein